MRYGSVMPITLGTDRAADDPASWPVEVQPAVLHHHTPVA
jgi:hypothetical protein